MFFNDMVTGIYVNLPVKNLSASMKFFSEMGFTFNEKFTDKTAAALELGNNIVVMLLTHTKFEGFVTKKIVDTKTAIESIQALQVESLEEVDTLLEKAVRAGATEKGNATDYGFMYSRTFYDLDGHMWEIFFMDESKFPQK